MVTILDELKKKNDVSFYNYVYVVSVYLPAPHGTKNKVVFRLAQFSNTPGPLHISISGTWYFLCWFMFYITPGKNIILNDFFRRDDYGNCIDFISHFASVSINSPSIPSFFHTINATITTRRCNADSPRPGSGITSSDSSLLLWSCYY